jgi:hypothetical protein
MRAKWMLLILLGLLLSSLALPAETTARRHRRHKAAAPKPIVLPPMPGGPLPQMPLDQIPATAPRVSYQQGSLSIVSHNSTLGDILREVRKQTGATIEIPQNASERVVTNLGPGPARDVLVNLLNGTSFNYTILGSQADPSALASVILTPRPAGGAEPAQTAAVYQPPVTQPNYGVPPPGMYTPPGQRMPVAVPQPQPQGQQDAVDENSDDNSDENADDNADENSDQSGDQQQPQQQMQQPGMNGAPTPDGQQPNAGPRTPEQILEMLRRNQQNGQPPVQPPNPGAPPDQQQ